MRRISDTSMFVTGTGSATLSAGVAPLCSGIDAGACMRIPGAMPHAPSNAHSGRIAASEPARTGRRGTDKHAGSI
ncbi:hypothetical protein thsbcT34_63410 [Burkholderia contaminans]